MRKNKNIISVIFFSVFFVFSNHALATVSLKLPYYLPNSLEVTQGYGNEQLCNAYQSTHCHKDLYALDLSGEKSLIYGKPVISSSEGTIYKINFSDEYGGGYGYYVEVLSENNLLLMYAHLEKPSSEILVNKKINQGELVGTIGNTGKVSPMPTPNDLYAGTHLHFAMYQKQEDGTLMTYKPEPISGYTEIAAGNWYVSDNELYDSRAYAQNNAATQTGGASFLSRVVDSVENIFSSAVGEVTNFFDNLFAKGNNEKQPTVKTASLLDAVNSISQSNENTQQVSTSSIQNQLDDISDKVSDISNALSPTKSKPAIITITPTPRSIAPTAVPIKVTAINNSNLSNTTNISSGGNSSNTNQAATPITSTTIVSTPVISSNVSHVLISEIQVAGVDAGDEFIELYNPNDNTLDISGWSIQYVSGSATTISPATVSRKNFVNGNTIPPKGFFLITRSLNSGGSDGYRGGVLPDMSHRSFSLSGASAGAKIFLVANQEDVTDVTDGDIIDMVDYSHNAPVAEESLERKAYASGACQAPSGANEFLGNGCDTDDISDFLVRAIPKPQNTSSLPESREAPLIQNLVGFYATSSLQIITSWDNANNTSLSGAPYTYAIEETLGSSTIALGTSTLLQFIFSTKEIGRDYTLRVKAIDREGMGGIAIATTLTIPSFFSRTDFYTDPNSSSVNYLMDFYYNDFPFVSDLYWNPTSTTWKAVIAYLDSDPDPQDLIQNTNMWQSTSGNAIAMKYNQCSGGISASLGATLIVPDVASRCGTGGGLSNVALDFRELEDNHVRIVLASSTSDVSFGPNDYLTFAFYSFYQSGGGQQTLKLVAVDKTRMYFSSFVPQTSSPTAPSDLTASFNTTMAKINFSWVASQDPDSLDSLITYSFRVNDGVWQNAVLESGPDFSRRYSSFSASPNTDYVIEVRATDERGNNSSVVSLSITTPNQPAPFGVSNMRWGYINTSSTAELSFNFPSYPFIPSGGYPWYGMIFYLNQDPPGVQSFNLQATDPEIVGSSTVISFNYPSCGSPHKLAVGIFIADPSIDPGLCFRRETLSLAPPQYLFSSSTSVGTTTISLQSSTYSPSDYITIGFYNTNNSGYPSGTFNLVARDLNKYYFSP